MLGFLIGIGLAAGGEIEALHVVENGLLQPGIPAPIEFLLLEETGVYGGLLESAETRGGQLLNLQRVEGMPWTASLQAEVGVSEVRLQLETEDDRQVQLRFPVARSPGLSFEAPRRVDGIAGQKQPILIQLRSDVELAPESVDVWSSEGVIQSIEKEKGGLVISLLPSEARQPHMGLIGIRDLTRPNLPPAWVPVRLRARPPVSVRTEPGTALTLKMGSRTYGPYRAGPDGSVSAKVDVYPGEQTATAFLSDSFGNTQKTIITVASAPVPVLGLFVEGTLSAGGTPPRIYLKGMTGPGGAWTGPGPQCTAAGGDALSIAKVGASAWVALLSESATQASFDLRVDCQLATHQQSVQVPVQRGLPHRVVLQVYPQVLSSDFPVAQVQAFLEDAAGERIGAEGIVLSADQGTLQSDESKGGRVRANYRGSSAQGADTIWARFDQAQGSGGVYSIQTGWRFSGDWVEISARVLNRQGRPLAERALELSLGEQQFSALSNEHGWVKGRFRSSVTPEILRVQTGLLHSSHLVTGTGSHWLDPGKPDFEDSQDLVFQAGRISQVFISVEPTILFGEPGAFADVHVRLLDRGGRTVPGEKIVVRVDKGVVDSPRPLADGSFVARVYPPQGMVTGEIVLSAEGGAGHFTASTTLAIEPRPQRIGIGVGAGYIQGLRGVSGPVLFADLESQLRVLDGFFQIRGGFMNWRDRAIVLDPARNQEVEVQLDNFALALHVIARRESGARSNWIGLGGTVAPFRQSVRFEGQPLIGGWGIHRPGIVFTAGAAIRALSGELSGELRWIGMNGQTGNFGYEGSVGGMAILLGYRVIL
jgi:hypothetical protein